MSGVWRGDEVTRFIEKCQPAAVEKIPRTAGGGKSRFPVRRRQQVEWQRVSRVMITAILSASAFKESFLDFCAS